MKKNLLVILLVLSGCAATGPISAPNFANLVANAIPANDGQMEMYGTATWYANTKGFTAVRSAFLSKPADPIPGVLVLTNNAILFQQWEETTKSYDVIKRFEYKDLLSSTLDSYGLGRRIVIRKKDLSFDTFEFTRGNGGFIDGKKVEESVPFLQKKIKQFNG